MERLMVIVLLAASVVPSVIGDGVPLLLKGRVYCDTCRCGFETPASKPIPGAVIRVECRDRATSQVTYTKHGTADSSGNYVVFVSGDGGNQICDSVLEKSHDVECSKASPGRDRARVVLTRNNGMDSNVRFANAMGFERDTPLSSCQQILMQYNDD